MLLAMDVGNTNTVIALYDGENLRRSWRMATEKSRASDEIGVLLLQFLKTEQLDATAVDAVILSSVVPPVMHALKNAIKRYFGCRIMEVGPGVKTGMNIRCDDPKEVGADQIANAVAAVKKYGAPLIVVDYGTATTFCVVDQRGDYLGGLIVPGLKISMDALFERAAKLPRIEIKKPPALIGKTTVGSMQAGAFYALAAQTDGIVERIRAKLGQPDCRVIATGGLAGFAAEEAETIDVVDRRLTLDGLRLIYEKNC